MLVKRFSRTVQLAMISLSLSMGACSSSDEQISEDMEVTQGEPAEVVEADAMEESVESEVAEATDQATDVSEEVSQEMADMSDSESMEEEEEVTQAEMDIEEEIAEVTAEVIAESAESQESIVDDAEVVLESEEATDQIAEDVEEEVDQVEMVSQVEESYDTVQSDNAGYDSTGETFTYVIREGDWVSKVAKRVYGDWSKWTDIASASGLSNPNKIFPNSTLVIPIINEQSRQFAQTYAANGASSKGTMVVKRGDTLKKIAERLTGSGDNWKSIFQANQGKITNPNLIYPGQVLKVSSLAH